jgi:hypothetical protein
MEQFIGLDVSLKDTFISVREGRQRIWRGKCPSDENGGAKLGHGSGGIVLLRAA